MARRTTNKWLVLLGLTAGSAVLAGTAAALTFAFYAPALPFVLGLSIGGVQLFAFAEALSLPLQIAALSGIAAGVGAVVTGALGVTVNLVTSMINGIASLFSHSSAGSQPRGGAEEGEDDVYEKKPQMGGLGGSVEQPENVEQPEQREENDDTTENNIEASNDGQEATVSAGMGAGM